MIEQFGFSSITHFCAVTERTNDIFRILGLFLAARKRKEGKDEHADGIKDKQV